MLKLLLIAIASSLLKTFSDGSISFGGILSIPVDFVLSIFLKSCPTSQAETFGKWLFPAMRFFGVIFVYSFDTFMVITW